MSTLDKIVFCGSFDPFTLGHYNIACRAAKMCDTLYIAVGVNTAKQRFISIDNAIKLIKKSMAEHTNVEVLAYDTTTVELCQKLGAKTLVHGLRNANDLDYEIQIETINLTLDNSIDNIYLTTPANIRHISSSAIREMVRFKLDTAALMPPQIDIKDYL